MKKEKCVVFDFSKGIRVGATDNLYKNGQLDLDLKIEVMSPEPVYGSNVINFRKTDKKRNNKSCKNGEEPSCTA
ncbi:MAG: hypothetical protein KAR21_02745 [Spirochaetales bacterium]|nr:hypothetical protein [Spirochaetales bacterium]